MDSVSPYKPPASALQDNSPAAVSRKGRYLVFDPAAALPSRCFKCNADTSNTRQLKLTYVNPWLYLSLLLTIILTIILVLIFQKKFSVDLPLCETHVRKRRNFTIFQWSMVALVVSGFFAGAVTQIDWLMLLALIATVIVIVSAIFGRLAFAAKYRNGNLWVTGAGKEFLNSLPDFAA